MEICSGRHVPIMKMGEVMESKQLLFQNILIPSFLKSNNTLVKETKLMVNNDSGKWVTVNQAVSSSHMGLDTLHWMTWMRYQNASEVRNAAFHRECRRAWEPTPVFLPGEFHGQGSLAGYSPWGHKESDMTERLLVPLLRREWTSNGCEEAAYTRVDHWW